MEVVDQVAGRLGSLTPKQWAIVGAGGIGAGLLWRRFRPRPVGDADGTEAGGSEPDLSAYKSYGGGSVGGVLPPSPIGITPVPVPPVTPTPSPFPGAEVRPPAGTPVNGQTMQFMTDPATGAMGMLAEWDAENRVWRSRDTPLYTNFDSRGELVYGESAQIGPAAGVSVGDRYQDANGKWWRIAYDGGKEAIPESELPGLGLSTAVGSSGATGAYSPPMSMAPAPAVATPAPTPTPAVNPHAAEIARQQAIIAAAKAEQDRLASLGQAASLAKFLEAKAAQAKIDQLKAA